MSDTSLTINNMGDIIRDRVRVAIVGAIPDAQVDALIAKEFEDFYKAPTRQEHKDQFGRVAYKNTGPTRFQQLVQKEIDEQMLPLLRAAVAVSLVGTEAVEYDEDGMPLIKGAIIDELTEQLAPIALQMFVKRISMQAIEALKQGY